MGLLDGLGSEGQQDRERQDEEQDVSVLDSALEILAQYVHGKHRVLNAAAASTDVLEKARAVVEVSSMAEPGKFVDAEDRAAVTRAARLAGQLLAARSNSVAEAIG